MADANPSPPFSRREFQRWLHVPAGAKPQIYEQVLATTEINSLTYWLEIFFASGIATFGLVQSSPAVIIGAMLISPLMGPIMATGLALAASDLYMGIKAVLNLIASVAVSIAFSGFLVWLLPFHSATPEIVARTNPNLLDLGVALLSGLAGSVVVCRGGGGGVTALPGVAIAVALMPPLCTVGFGLGSGANLEIMSGAGLLFLTNLVAIVASAFLIFLLIGMNTAEVRKSMEAARGSEPLARILAHGPVARVMVTGGQLRWRVLMLLVMLAAIAVPLRRALLQVAGETLTRGAVQEELSRLVPPDYLVSEQVSVSPDSVFIRVLSTRQIPDDSVTEVRQKLMRRTGRDVRISVDAVASKTEVADLMERLSHPVAAPPRLKTVAELQKELVDRIRPPLVAIWPEADAPMRDFDVVLGPQGIAVNVRYTAPANLGEVPIRMVEHGLQSKLGTPEVTVNAQRVRPQRGAR